MLDWVVQGQFGAFPTPSYDHCAVGLGKKVYLFGVSLAFQSHLLASSEQISAVENDFKRAYPASQEFLRTEISYS
jgi:hypothetical protein